MSSTLSKMPNNTIQIKDIRPGLKHINLLFIVLEVGNPIITKTNGELRLLKVSDPSACINICIFGELGGLLVPGDIVKLSDGYASFFRDSLTLYLGKTGEIKKVGEFCMIFNEQLDMSKPNPALKGQYNSTTNILLSSKETASNPSSRSPISNSSSSRHSPLSLYENSLSPKLNLNEDREDSISYNCNEHDGSSSYSTHSTTSRSSHKFSSSLKKRSASPNPEDYLPIKRRSSDHEQKASSSYKSDDHERRHSSSSKSSSKSKRSRKHRHRSSERK